MNVIIGGGLIGLLAREILGPDWLILPQGRSRYYTFNPPLADNHVAYSKDLVGIFDQFSVGAPRYFMRAVSNAGALAREIPMWARPLIVDRIFGENPHPLAKELIDGGCMVFSGQAIDIYDNLVARFKNELVKNTEQYGRVLKVEDSTIKTERGIITYNRIISTIPLGALSQISNTQFELSARDNYCYTLATDALDLEGASQVYITDSDIPFYKVNAHGHMRYQFFAHSDLGDATKVLGAFTKNRLKIESARCIISSMPLGAPPDLSKLILRNIDCVGAEAQWDWFMDIAACARKLVRIRQSALPNF